MALKSLVDARARRIVREHADLTQWPQPGAALGLFAGLLVGMCILAIYDMRQVVSGDTTGFGAINNLAVVALLILPIVSGLYAVKLPRDEIHKKDFAYTYCARCPRWVLLQGYSLTTIYRMRLTLAFSAGGIPFFAAGLVHATLRRAYQAGAMVFGTFGDVAGMLVFFFAFSISFWGFNLLMTAIGTIEGLRGRSMLVTIFRVLLPLALLALPFLMALMLVGPYLTTPYHFMTIGQQILLIAFAILLILYPFGATYFLVRTRAEGAPIGG